MAAAISRNQGTSFAYFRGVIKNKGSIRLRVEGPGKSGSAALLRGIRRESLRKAGIALNDRRNEGECKLGTKGARTKRAKRKGVGKKKGPKDKRGRAGKGKRHRGFDAYMSQGETRSGLMNLT